MPTPKPPERKNNTELCSSCGAQMTMNPDAVVNSCGVCGERFIGFVGVTPPVESLGNICPVCPHPIDPDHDNLGCHALDCPCTATNDSQMGKMAASLSNATDKDAWGKMDEAARKAAAAKAGVNEQYGHVVKWDAIPQEIRDKIGVAISGLPNAVDAGPKAPKPFAGLPENSNNAPDFKKALAAFEAHAKTCAQCGPVWQATDDAGRDVSKLCATGSQLLVADLENAGKGNCEYCKGKGKVPSDADPMADEECPHCHGTGSENENKNAAPTPEGMWNFAAYSQLCGILEQAGLDVDLAHTSWSALPADVKTKITPLLAKMENTNAGDVHPSKRKCPKCDFVGYPTDVVSHLQRQHGVSQDEAHDMVPAPENSNAGDPVAKWRGNPRVRIEGQPKGTRIAFVDSDGEGVESSDAAIEREVKAGRTVTIVLANGQNVQGKCEECGHEAIHHNLSGECRHRDCPEGNQCGKGWSDTSGPWNKGGVPLSNQAGGSLSNDRADLGASRYGSTRA